MTVERAMAMARAELAAYARRGQEAPPAIVRAMNRLVPPADGHMGAFDAMLAGIFARARESLGPVDPTCYGAETSEREPACDGPDVRPVRAQAPGGPWFTTDWCAECRRAAEVQGYVVEPLPEGQGDAEA